MILTILITTLESVLEVYRIYRAIRYRKKVASMVHPEICKDVNIVDV